MANQAAPDSWEQQADSAPGDSADPNDMSAKFSTLNVNAAEFVPSFFSPPKPEESNADLESGDSPVRPVTNGKHTIGLDKHIKQFLFCEVC